MKARYTKQFKYTIKYLIINNLKTKITFRSGLNVEEIKHHKSRLVLIDWITISPSVSKAGKNVDLVSYSVGRKYRGKFYPGTDYVDRQCYTGKIFKEANKFIKNGDWENARKVLLKMTESNDPKISQEKVAHNLSIVYEALGDIESSKNWDSK